jgi:hypothetical protein
MISKTYRTALVASAVLIALLSSTTPVLAAAPRVMLVYGPPLTRPVMLQNWDENLRLMQAVTEDATATSRELKHRPFLSVALFWGMYWGQYLQHGKPLAVFRPERANQCAWFYPAYGRARPLWVFRSVPVASVLLIRRVSPTGIAILARHGVPVRLAVGRHLATSTNGRCQAP